MLLHVVCFQDTSLLHSVGKLLLRFTIYRVCVQCLDEIELGSRHPETSAWPCANLSLVPIKTWLGGNKLITPLQFHWKRWLSIFHQQLNATVQFYSKVSEFWFIDYRFTN